LHREGSGGISRILTLEVAGRVAVRRAGGADASREKESGSGQLGVHPSWQVVIKA